MNSIKQNLINKIVYRAQYRGTKEMDILLTSFVNSIIKSLSVKDLEDLNNVINMNDEDILRIANAEIINQDYKNNKIVELLINFKKNINGGETGIRTQERVAPLPVFKTGAFNRSAISPLVSVYFTN